MSTAGELYLLGGEKKTCKTVEAIMHIDLWKMKGIYEKGWITDNKMLIEQDNINQWIKEYWSEDRWLDFIPQKPSMGVLPLDELTAKCWDIYEKPVTRFKLADNETKGRSDTVWNECHRNEKDEFWKPDIQRGEPCTERKCNFLAKFCKNPFTNMDFMLYYIRFVSHATDIDH